MATTPSSAAARKRAETRLLSSAVHSFITAYKGWLEDALRREKLTLPQLRLLRAVEQGQGESAASIARACHVTPQTLQIMLERAVREKWIVRTHSERNSRILTAALTPRGEAILAQGKQLASDFEQQVWAGTGVATLQQCTAILQRGVASMDRIRAAETSARPASATGR